MQARVPQAAHGQHVTQRMVPVNTTAVTMPPHASPPGTASTGKGALYQSLDDVPDECVAAQRQPMLSTLRRNMLMALVLALAVAGITVAQALEDPWWVLWFRSIAVFRTLVLFVTILISFCCGRRIHVIVLAGTGEPGQALVALGPFFALWLWRFLGYFDFYIGRLIPPLINIVTAIAIKPPLPADVALTRIGLDVLIMIEYSLSIWLIHSRGIWNNTRYHLNVA